MEKPIWSKIDKQLVLEPEMGEKTSVQLTARAQGWQIGRNDTTSPVAGAFVRIRPISAQVRSERGEETVEFTDPVNAALRAMLGTALLISLVCWIIMRITVGLVERKKQTSKRR